MIQEDYKIDDEIIYDGTPGVIDSIDDNGEIKIRTNDGIVGVEEADLMHVELAKAIDKEISSDSMPETNENHTSAEQTKALQKVIIKTAIVSFVVGVIALLSEGLTGGLAVNAGYYVGSVLGYFIVAMLLSSLIALIRMIFIKSSFKESINRVTFIVVIVLAVLSILGNISNMVVAP